MVSGPRLSIWVGTWNINASRAWNAEDLSSWFRLSYHHPSPGSGDHDDDKDSHLRDVALCCLGEAMVLIIVSDIRYWYAGVC